MRGIETKILLEIIVTLIILVVLYLIVVNPSMLFASGTKTQMTFREFCFHWSIVGYPKSGYPNGDGNLVIDKYTYSIATYCSSAGVGDLDACIKMCKGAA
jgi:hypothetical protein